MKIFLRNGLIYCSTLILTGRACTEALPAKFQREKQSTVTGIIGADHQAFKEIKVKGGNIVKVGKKRRPLDIVDQTNNNLEETAKRLKKYGARLHSSDPNKGIIDRAIEKMTKTVAGLKEWRAKPHPSDKEEAYKSTTPNFMPRPNKAALEHVTLVDKNLTNWGNIVHKHIPKIQELALITILTQIEKKINMLVYIRTKDNDTLLRDEAKEMLRNIKIKIKTDQNDPCNIPYTFYRRISNLINERKNIEEKEAKAYEEKAKKIKKRLLKRVKEINDLVEMLTIQKKDCKNNSNGAVRLKRYKGK